MRTNRLVAAVLAGSMVFGSTGAIAATAPHAAAQQPSPWAALSGLTAGAPAAALCGVDAASDASQVSAGDCTPSGTDAPVGSAYAEPPAPVPVPALAAASESAMSPLLMALGLLAAGALTYFLVRNHHHTVSPA